MGGRLPEAGADLTTLRRRDLERAMERVRAVTLGRVETFTATAAGRLHPTATVQTLIPRWVDDDSPVHDPPLDDVPILFPGSTLLRMDWRLTAGDLVLVLFCDRQIDDVAEQLHGPQATDPQPVDAASTRMHDVSDAVAIPVATYGASGQLDVLDAARLLITILQAATVNTALGPQPFMAPTQAALTALLAQIDAVR